MKRYQTWKRLADIVGSILLILATSPVLVIASLLIAIIDGFPIIYRQRRLGIRKRQFTIYKLRTMREGGRTAACNNYVTTIDDARITRLGRILRRSSIDELPQLFNVLMGQMSIVGPRPAVHDELGDVRTFNDKLNRRFEGKPGITGHAQVMGRNELTWEDKIEIDNRYLDLISRNGLATDLNIILKTLLVLANGLFRAKGIFESTSTLKVVGTDCGEQ